MYLWLYEYIDVVLKRNKTVVYLCSFNDAGTITRQ